MNYHISVFESIDIVLQILYSIELINVKYFDKHLYIYVCVCVCMCVCVCVCVCFIINNINNELTPRRIIFFLFLKRENGVYLQKCQNLGVSCTN